MSMSVINSKSRVYYLDILRTIGSLAVVLLHVSSIFTLEPYGSINYWLGVIFDGAAQCAVPLFVMISGTLFLDENYVFTTAKLWKHIKKLVLFFVGWSLIYFLVFSVIKNVLLGRSIDLLDAIIQILDGPFHLWFIPMVLGLYLVVPFLRLWIKKENKAQIKQFLILGFLFNCILPLAEYIIGSFLPSVVDIVKLSTKLHFCYGTGYVFYFILGWYLHNFPISHKRSICIGGVLGLMVTILGTIIFTGMNVESSYFFSNFSIGIFCTSVSVFVCVKSLFQDKEGPSFFVNLICSHSMGIYAMHMGVFPLFTYILKIKYAVLAIPVYFIFAVALPLVGSIVLRRIRIFRFLV